jgi:hypothetical protein
MSALRAFVYATSVPMIVKPARCRTRSDPTLSQFPALDADGQAMVRAMIDGLRAMLQQALLAAGADEQEAAERALCTLAANQSLAVLSRAGFSGDDLATVASSAARIPVATKH